MIRFPKEPMADRVQARLMKLAQEQANSVPVQGARIDAALSQPVGDVAAVDGIEDIMVTRALGL